MTFAQLEFFVLFAAVLAGYLALPSYRRGSSSCWPPASIFMPTGTGGSSA